MRWIKIALVLVIAIVLTACQPAEFDLSALQNSDGGFGYPGLEWNMSLTELETALGYRFDAPDFSSVAPSHNFREDPDYEFAIFSIDEKEAYVRLFGCGGKVSYQFQQGRLIDITVGFSNRGSFYRDNDLEKLADELLAALIQLFGEDYEARESDLSEYVQRTVKATGYTWAHPEENGAIGRLGLLLSYNSEGLTTVSLALSNFLPSANQQEGL